MQNKTNPSQKQVDSQRKSEEVLLSEETYQELENILGVKLNRSHRRKFDRSPKNVLSFNKKPIWAVQEFFKCPEDYYHRLTATQQRILHVLVQYCLNYRKCFVSYATVAALSGCCEKTVYTAVELFRSDGVIGTMYRHKTTNLFRLATDWRRQSVIDSLKKYFPVLKFVLSSFLLLSRVAPIPCMPKNYVQSTKESSKEVIFSEVPLKDEAASRKNRVSNPTALSNYIHTVMDAQKRTPEKRPIEVQDRRTLNGQQPKIKKEGSKMLSAEEKRKLSLPPAYKEKPPTPPAYKPYTAKPRVIPHEDIYISYFKLQDHYRENGNPLNLPNPYRAKFIELVEESCAGSDITKTQLKEQLYKLYLAKKEDNGNRI